MSDMPVTDRMKRQREEERLEVYALGKQIGFGNMMSLASEAWQAELESNYGSDAGAFVVGPCKGLVVPCGCGGSKDCDWCCATGWLTKKVKEIKDAKPNDRIVEDGEDACTHPNAVSAVNEVISSGRYCPDCKCLLSEIEGNEG